MVLVHAVAQVGCAGSKPATSDGGTRDSMGNEASFDLTARYHGPGSSTPATCLPCHGPEAPTSTEGWQSTTYALSPFDYGKNALGIAHGGDQDCAVCHKGPGTGAWGDRPNWVGGHFVHQPFSLSETTCIACLTSQRPDLQPGASAASAAALLGFDHARYPGMDCIGCHFATVAADSYVHYLNPVTMSLPGGDWKGGQSYPGATPVGFPGERITLLATTLAFSEQRDLVLGATQAYEVVPDVMIHTASTVPPELRSGPPDAPDYGTCWHCHHHRNGVVTMFPPGKFHVSLRQYRSTPDAPVTSLPQPTRGCSECHAVTRPAGLIGRSPLRPMHHGSEFASPAIVAGLPAASVRDLDCSVCHQDPLGLFRDGTFHLAIAGATPKECVGCHYLTMVDGPTADTRNGTAYEMRHLSAQVTFHTCTTCHPSALANATSATLAAESWKPGYFHTVLARQPTACNDCHAPSIPSATLAAFDHGSLASRPRDCGECHVFPGTGTPAKPNWRGGVVPVE